MHRTVSVASLLKATTKWSFSPRHLASASAPPPTSAQEGYLSATNSSYIDEMYESWARDPKSVHASWDAHFRGAGFQAPPGIGITKSNEVALSSIAPALAGLSGSLAAPGTTLGPSSKIIDAHLAVQTCIRSYQVRDHIMDIQGFYSVGVEGPPSNQRYFACNYQKNCTIHYR